MTALSDILAGLFVYALLVVGLGLGKTGLAAAIAIAVTMLPPVARASEVALRIVPGSPRQASEALGATHWKTTWKVVLPSARAGLVTAGILAIARGIGETAVVLVTTGATSFFNANPVSEPMTSLPLFIFTAYQTHQPQALTRVLVPPACCWPWCSCSSSSPGGSCGTRPDGRAPGPATSACSSARVQMRRWSVRRIAAFLGAGVIGALVWAPLVGPGRARWRRHPLQINGSGSSWAANAINLWVTDVFNTWERASHLQPRWRLPGPPGLRQQGLRLLRDGRRFPGGRRDDGSLDTSNGRPTLTFQW